MKFFLNTDNESYASLWHYARLLREMDLRDDESDIVLNISSISNKHIAKGKVTIYIEGDDFIIRGSNKDIYKEVDILYTYTKKYLHYYPDGTKLITGYFDPDWHYPRDVKKDHEYSFIASLRTDPVYDKRKEIIEELCKRGRTMFIKECEPINYPDMMCRGKIILNILPETHDGQCSPNNRVFEGIGMGTLMCNQDEVLDDLGLIPNVHYLPIERFGEDFTDEELKRVHETGRAFILHRYSYQNAIKQIIKDVEDYERQTSLT